MPAVPVVVKSSSVPVKVKPVTVALLETEHVPDPQVVLLVEVTDTVLLAPLLTACVESFGV